MKRIVLVVGLVIAVGVASTQAAWREKVSFNKVTIENQLTVEDGATVSLPAGSTLATPVLTTPTLTTPIMTTGSRMTEGVIGTPITFGATSYYTFFDDFITAGYEQNVSAFGTNGQAMSGQKYSEVADEGDWLVTVVDTDGDEAEEVYAQDAAAGGIVGIRLNADESDKMNLQLNGESFQLSSGKELWFECRFAVEDASTNSVFIGLATSDTDVVGSLPNDHIGFIALANTALSISVEMNNSNDTYATTTTLHDQSGFTNMTTVGFYWNGVSTVNTWVLGNGSGSIAASTSVVHTAGTVEIPTDEQMSPVFSFNNTGGNDVADKLYVDYIKIVAER